MQLDKLIIESKEDYESYAVLQDLSEETGIKYYSRKLIKHYWDIMKSKCEFRFRCSSSGCNSQTRSLSNNIDKAVSGSSEVYGGLGYINSAG